MTATLTDRYLTAVTRRVPDKQRRDIERELRAAIGDSTDARVEGGQSPEEAEYAALSELGNPARLASRYATRPLALIGPDLYPDCVRALRGLAMTVLPLVYVVLALVQYASGANVAEAVFSPLGSTMTVAMYLAVGVIVLFSVVDRAVASRPGSSADSGGWTPDLLPRPEVRRPAGWSDVASVGVKAAFVIALLVVERWVSPVTDTAGSPVPVIDPALWHGWIPYFMAVIVLAVVLQVVNVRLRRWSRGTAVIGTVLTLAGSLPLAWLAWQARVINPAIPHVTGSLTTPGSWLSWLVILFPVLVTVARLNDIWRGGRPTGEVV
ncbi:permease prefix domain 1-containing protein [Streptomyces sp. 150FB]|uniref:permease prefix domain 1-containing protein n=1 Tax=Streptomyces sp. 150FB TaxID=1576605 RepID=UPI0006986D8C|nr:permease prefix domain 1-containing protein [Streptomyces sp. 150FB]